MALNTATSRGGRRVSLTRKGAKPGRNCRIEPRSKRTVTVPRQVDDHAVIQDVTRSKRTVTVPWQGIARFFGTAAFLSVLLLCVAAVGFGLLYSYRGMVSGEYFALKTIEIRGNLRLSSREILETADLLNGANTLALSIDAVEETLAAHPWVEEVSVKRVLPSTLIISIREKSPAFWVLHDGALHYADAYGRSIAPVIAGKFASLPMLEVEPGAEDAAAALPDLVKSLQESRLSLNLASISMVRLSSARGVEVYVDNAGYKISIGLEEWLQNLRRLGMTMADLTRRGELDLVREIRAQGANVWVERRSSVGVAE